MANKMMRINTPEVGALAIHHSGNLDGRFVAEVSEDQEHVRLDLSGRLTEWVPTAHYNFYKENK